MTEFKTHLTAALDEMAWEYTGEQLEKAEIYWDFLLATNCKINLTAITDPQDGAVKHFADSLCLVKYGNISENATLMDIGTGAGFPGMVLAIFREDLKITLLDSLEKRCNFLNDLVEKVNLTNVNVIWGRGEEVGRHPDFRGALDYTTARAVASLPVLVEYALPLLKVGGHFLAMKGPGEEPSPEKALEVLGGELSGEWCYKLPISQEERRIVEVVKVAETPEKYPRRPGKPTKSPLGVRASEKG